MNAHGGLAGRLDVVAADRSAADAAVLRSEPVRNFSLMSGEALRTAPGMVEDYRAWMRPWGFAPEDLTVPVDVWVEARANSCPRTGRPCSPAEFPVPR